MKAAVDRIGPIEFIAVGSVGRLTVPSAAVRQRGTVDVALEQIIRALINYRRH